MWGQGSLRPHFTCNRAIVTTNDDKILEFIVRQADENQAVMDGTMEPVLSIMDAADIVVAIWRDKDQPNGIGQRVVKGHLLLQRCDATNQPISLKTTKLTGIWCVAQEQAVALEKFYAKRN
jgi:hypothetical protein